MYLDSCLKPGLRFTDYAASLFNTTKKATENSDGALTVGIFGKWGTGKTTLMRSVEQEFLRQRENEGPVYKTIWFSPWKYDSKEKIWNALIQSILAEIENDIDSSKRKTCQDLAWLMRFYAYEVGRELVLGWAKQQVKQASGIDLAALKQISQVDSTSEMYRNLNRFEEDFKKLVEDYVGTCGRLVIFIDDLDRCLPTEALTVLEALKLYLDRANCVFFIGLDRRTIEQAVREKYSSVDITGKDYIEKMIHLNFFIPQNDPLAIEDVLKGQMNSLTCNVDKRLWKPISIATGQNLRRMKQYLIAWDLLQELLPNIEPEPLREVATFLLLQMYFPRFYDALSLYNYTFMDLFVTAINSRSNNQDGQYHLTTLAKFPELDEFWKDNSLRAFFECALHEDESLRCLPSTSSTQVLASITKLSAVGQRKY
jgi:hypothetical protein